MSLGNSSSPAHVVKRAQGGSDFDLVALCPPCHAQTDAPYARGRLVVMPSGSGRFIFELWEGTGKETSQVMERWENPALHPAHSTHRTMASAPVSSPFPHSRQHRRCSERNASRAGREA
jgi:hypothetical protein